jgi:hypothetical protein
MRRFISALALGVVSLSGPTWLAVVVVIAFALFYKNPLEVLVVTCILEAAFFPSTGQNVFPVYLTIGIVVYMLSIWIRPKIRS